MQETWIQYLSGEDTLEKRKATHSSLLAWRIPGTEEPGGVQSMGSQSVGHDWSNWECMQRKKKRGMSFLFFPFFENKGDKENIQAFCTATSRFSWTSSPPLQPLRPFKQLQFHWSLLQLWPTIPSPSLCVPVFLCVCVFVCVWQRVCPFVFLSLSLSLYQNLADCRIIHVQPEYMLRPKAKSICQQTHWKIRM